MLCLLINTLTKKTMSYTNDWKEDNIDRLFDWVHEIKGDEMFDYFDVIDEDRYEEYIEQFVEDHKEKLWAEFIATLPEQ